MHQLCLVGTNCSTQLKFSMEYHEANFTRSHVDIHTTRVSLPACGRKLLNVFMKIKYHFAVLAEGFSVCIVCFSLCEMQLRLYKNWCSSDILN